MRSVASCIVIAVILAACGAGTSAPTAAPTAPATASPTPAPTLALTTTAAPATPGPSRSFKAGLWPAEWQFWICEARAEMLREDAAAGGRAGEDAATQAIADLKATTINWDPGADLRALIGRAAFILFDAAPRGGVAMNDVPPVIKAFEQAYTELRDATGFECPA